MEPFMETKTVQINKFLELKLKGDMIEIYVGGRFFRHCTYLLLNIPKDKIEDCDSITFL